jgi:DNA-binding NarL/FixJ family response regulator
MPSREQKVPESIRVFLVDDHEIVRRGVAELLQSQPGIEVVGEAGTIALARTRIAATRPDVALLDVRLPDGNGIDLCRDLLSGELAVRCLMLTAYDDDEAMSAAVLAGASGYVLKDVRGSGLVDAVRKVASGRSLIDPLLSKRLIEQMSNQRGEDDRLALLSTREREVLALIADGLTNREIGEALDLAEKTVKNYVSTLLSKLGLQRRTQAVVLQMENRFHA